MFSWLFNPNYGGVVNYFFEKLTGAQVFWMS